METVLNGKEMENEMETRVLSLGVECVVQGQSLAVGFRGRLHSSQLWESVDRIPISTSRASGVCVDHSLVAVQSQDGKGMKRPL